MNINIRSEKCSSQSHQYSCYGFHANAVVLDPAIAIKFEIVMFNCGYSEMHLPCSKMNSLVGGQSGGPPPSLSLPGNIEILDPSREHFYRQYISDYP